jgi:glycosyltransferase involved in cell wall biosynthesis
MSDTTPVSLPISEDEASAEIAEAKNRYAPASAEFKSKHEQINRQMEGDVRDRLGYHYVAEPAEGHDVVGLWHTFPCGTRSGYAAHAVALHSMLERLGAPTMLAPFPGMDIDISKFPEDREPMLMRWLKTSVGIPKAFIASFPPDLRGLDRGAPAFVSYVAFEASPMSEYARRLCAAPELTWIWCVSEFTRRCYIESGIDPNKICVVRPALCDGPWTPMLHQRPARTDGPFVFGVNGSWHERKGFHKLVRAYLSAFSRSDNVILALRTSYFGSGRDQPLLMDFERQVLGEIGTIKLDYQKPGWESPRFKLLGGTGVTDAELIEWLGGLDCYVNPSFGEGLGIPLIWAAAQGVPVVTSDFGAVGDLAREVSSMPDASSAFRVFPSKLTPVPRAMLKHSTLLSTKSCWGDYEVDALAAQMRAAYDAGRVRSVETAQDVTRRFSFDATRATLVAALREFVDEETLRSWSGT